MLKSKTLYRRMLAAIIDYGVIAVYAILLLICTNLIFSKFNWKLGGNPYIGQLTGFITLTLPVVIYSWLAEKSNWKGAAGKKLLKLIVVSDPDTAAKNILLRNVLKFLPWELAHTGVHWTIYYTSKNVEPPLWTWLILILPQFLAIAYIISIVKCKGESSIYDNFSKTKIAYIQIHSIDC